MLKFLISLVLIPCISMVFCMFLIYTERYDKKSMYPEGHWS